MLRELPMRARATSWGEQRGRTLFESRVVIVGAGGVARALLALLAPFRCHVTVVRRRAEAVPGAHATVTPSQLRSVVRHADAVVVAAAMTAHSRALIGAAELTAMKSGSVLVNVARGGLIDTTALEALGDDVGPSGIALDVTDPEPLPMSSRLWSDPRFLITPHTADTWDMIRPLLSQRISSNVAAFLRGEPLTGVVDPAEGY